MEQFDPTNPEYKKVADLPKKERDNFVDLEEGGFVRKEWIESVRQFLGNKSEKDRLADMKNITSKLSNIKELTEEEKKTIKYLLKASVEFDLYELTRKNRL